ncbi:MAG TPA: helicase C-terminal domain-containing protein [Kiritimatiellia bacterium]|nr:helicase C-terminal domain-containing protein [Kiritimatiellia bacterium]HNR94247.1 helicase C-terminal domain-containing protein [Kiritimatiellia bacterium]HNS81582.1 helicase C-terminal domain-containing protein [Kiritimatiellia bacterium]
MISPARGRSGEKACGEETFPSRADAFFRPGGLLEEACHAEEFPYEERPQQRTMACAVAGVIHKSSHLAVEAGTGVGKSFAYLVPLIYASLERRERMVVATYTISLQEQLIYKDIPFLQKVLGDGFKAVLVKGRSNYLCLRRLGRTFRMGKDLFAGAGRDEVAEIRKWAETTEEGSLQSMAVQPSSEIWSQVCAEHGNCLGRKCPHFKPCFFMRARAQMQEANLLVLNHHLLFSDIQLRRHRAAFLPKYTVIVLDEAHQMEDVASEHFGIRLSHYAFEHWMRRLYVSDTNKGLLAALRRGDAAHEVTELGRAVDDLYLKFKRWAAFRGDETQRVLTAPPALETDVPARLDRLAKMLEEIIENTEDDDVLAELEAIRRHGMGMAEELRSFLSQSLPDQVYWVEKEGRRRSLMVLHAAPIEVAPVLSEALFKSSPCVVMTSATLAVGGSLEYFKTRVGAENCESLETGSPFNYQQQMRVLIPRKMPDPKDMNEYLPAVTRAVEHFVIESRGRAFVLFTNAGLMRKVAAATEPVFTGAGLQLFVQGAGLARHVMLDRFRESPAGVLFGVSSFWMGVDVRGGALSNVIITRLPFAVPDQPLIKARLDRIKEKGGDPFKEYSLPEAILRFRQGVGRLIRTNTDEGRIIVLDRRIADKWYGRLFFSAIPECPVEEVDIPGDEDEAFPA